MLSRSTPEYVVRQTVSAISSAMAKMAFLNSSKPKGSAPPARAASAVGRRPAVLSPCDRLHAPLPRSMPDDSEGGERESTLAGDRGRSLE